MLAPAMIAVGLATFVVGNRSIYRSQLVNRSESPAHRFRVAMPLMAAIPVGDAARQAMVIARADETVAAVRQRVEAASVPGAPVLAADGSVLGVVDASVLATAEPGVAVGTVTDKGVPRIEATGGLDDALGALASQRRSWAPVVSDGRLTGILSARDAMSAYRSALQGNVRQVRGLRADGVIVEATVGAGSTLDGRRVADIAWPARSVLVAVVRDESLAVPRGDLVLAAGDRVSVFADPVARADLERLLSAPAVPPAVPPADSPPDPLPAVPA
jgi:CBS domain-containing protein